jgi:hypothetical protein
MNRQILALCETVLRHEYPETPVSMNNLAHFLTKLCCYEESLALYKRACAGYHIVLGEDHPNTCACRQGDATARMDATKHQRTPALASKSSFQKFKECNSHLGKFI